MQHIFNNSVQSEILMKS